MEVDGVHNFIANGICVHNCSAPNLQNIPRPDTPDGKLLRETFIACLDDYCMPDLNGDEVLVVGDLGQIELVILAHLIGYGHLFEGFWNGIDPHTVHAAGVLGKAPEDVTKDERQALGKTLGFTIVNGAGPSLVGSMIGGDYKDGLALMKKYDKDFPEVPAFKRKVFEACRDRTPPHVVSLLGRRRTVPSILSGDRGKRSAAERQVFNSLIQGGAADLIKLGMIRTDDRLQQHVPEAYLTMTIHDELVAVSPRNKAEQVRELMIDGMTGPGIQRYVKVPLTVECSIGERWSDCK
jgi:DNA polymerase-1